ncbi:hypothetical protein [Oscillibacter sp.]|nr:hypothetical protein [Oscillibacter sp.]
MTRYENGPICRQTRQIAERMNKTIAKAAIFGEIADKKPMNFIENEIAV